MVEMGTCEFCGQQKMLLVAAEDMETADRAAAMMCHCQEGREWRRMMESKATVEEIFKDMDPDAVNLLHAVVDATRRELIESGSSLKMAENVTAKVTVKKGSVIVTRSDRLERQSSV